MPREIQIEIRNVYGQPKAYPACEQAETFSRIAGGTKTLTRAVLANIFKLGFTIIEVNRYGGHVATYRPESTEECYELTIHRIAA